MLELHNVGFTHDDEHWLFRGVSGAVPAGQVLAVLGPNGRGKTTLLRCVVGLTNPTEGQVQADVPVGFVPQNHGSAFAYTALDMVLMGRVRHLRVLSPPRPARLRPRVGRAGPGRAGRIC